jgi:competence protein ComFC
MGSSAVLGTFNAFLDLIFPPKCLVCGASGSDIFCRACLDDIRPIGSFCEICGKPHQDGLYGETSAKCSDCKSLEPPFDLARSIAKYDGSLKAAIHKFKFRNKKGLAAPLAGIMIEHLSKSPWQNILPIIDIVTAVPLHRKRQNERGYNQSEILARSVAEKFGLNFSSGILEKVKDTKRQFDLKRAERFSNVRGAFKAVNEVCVNGRNVLLVDDILTTGATAAECARLLKGAGAGMVFVLTLSHAVE